MCHIFLRVNYLGLGIRAVSVSGTTSLVALWENLNLSKVTAAGLGQKCPYSGGATCCAKLGEKKAQESRLRWSLSEQGDQDWTDGMSDYP